MPLVKSILKGISDTADADFQRLTVKEEQSDLINSILNSAGTIPTETDEKVKMSSIKKVTGGVLPISLSLESAQGALHRRIHRRGLGQLPHTGSDHGGA